MSRAPQPADAAPKATRYSYYILALLVCSNTLCYLDRTILSIVAERIRVDIKVSDASLGFLYGTAFAVCYSIFVIPMGRLADRWRRTSLLGIGLTLWSGMTALTGLATNFGQLAVARVFVGIGEATSVANMSLIPDLFPRGKRGAPLGIYLSGIALGSGLALLAGGLILHIWDNMCGAHCGIAAWRATFLLVGLPGLVVALLLLLAREPVRGAMDGIVTHAEQTQKPLKILFEELSAVIPPFPLIHLMKLGGWRPMLLNAVVGGALAAAAALLIITLGDAVQWIGLGAGFYAAFSLFQSLALRDVPAFRMTLGSPTFIGITVGVAILACIVTAITFWATPYAMRTFHLSAGASGVRFGLATLVCAAAGTVLGGVLTDRWRRYDLRGGVWITCICLAVVVPMALLMFLTKSFTLFFIGYIAICFVQFSCAPGVALQIQELVMPRMRAQTSAVFGISVTIFTFAVGPYMAGKVSEMTGSLATGVLSVLVLAPIAAIGLWVAARTVVHAETHRLDRARAAGEPIDL